MEVKGLVIQSLWMGDASHLTGVAIICAYFFDWRFTRHNIRPPTNATVHTDPVSSATKELFQYNRHRAGDTHTFQFIDQSRVINAVKCFRKINNFLTQCRIAMKFLYNFFFKPWSIF